MHDPCVIDLSHHNPTPNLGQVTEMLTGRNLVRAFVVTLPLIRRAAERAAHHDRQLDRLRRRYWPIDEDRLWTVYLLSKLHRKHMAQKYNSERHSRLVKPAERQLDRLPPPNQRELQERAQKAHWTQIVWKSGTDHIVRVNHHA